MKVPDWLDILVISGLITAYAFFKVIQGTAR